MTKKKRSKPQSLVQMAAVAAAKEAQEKVETGRVPIVLSAEALIALLWDKFQRHIRGEPLALLDAASACLLVLAKGMQEPRPITIHQRAEAQELDLEVVDESEEQGEKILCPKCGRDNVKCTKLILAQFPICDQCIAELEREYGDEEKAIKAYEEWVKQVKP